MNLKAILIVGALQCMVAISFAEPPAEKAMPKKAEGFGVEEQLMLDADTMALINSRPKGLPTNGLFCSLDIYRPRGKELTPKCVVDVVNLTTNVCRGILHLPRETLLQMDLFDANGKPVEKTAAGKQFNLWTQKQMEEWLKEQIRIRWSGRSVDIVPTSFLQFASFGVPEIFQLNAPGEYILHLKMQLIEPKWTQSQKLDHLQVTWLPEVVTKIQIQAEDVQKASTTTNIPGK